jgi:hypothetical protein
MGHTSAQAKLKAVVVARLLMGDFDSWEIFARERATTDQIRNRQVARSVAAQIGKSYKGLSGETQKFISANFERCDYSDLAKLCDAVRVGHGVYQRMDDFEREFFPLAERIRDRAPFHAHVSISIWGLQFEFPEHHFLRDLEIGLASLREIELCLDKFQKLEVEPKLHREEVADLVGRERFLSRSVVSAAFSLVEAYLCGLFLVAAHTRTIGMLKCDEIFQKYVKDNEERAPLKGRLDQMVRFVSKGHKCGRDEPFKSFIEVGKRYRDAIHHTTPFGRKDIEPGGRMVSLYEINSDLALKCAQLSSETVLTISRWAYGDPDATTIGARCADLSRTVQHLQDKRYSAEPSIRV